MGVSTTVNVVGFDKKSLKKNIPAGASAYVKEVLINGSDIGTRCHFDFYDSFRIGGNITIVLTDDMESVNDCAGSLPDSLSTGGFSKAR